MVCVDLVGVAEGDKPCGLAAGLSPGLTCQGVLSGDGGELVLGVEQGPDQTGVAVAEPAFEEVGVEEACEGLEEVGKGVVAAGLGVRLRGMCSVRVFRVAIPRCF